MEKRTNHLFEEVKRFFEQEEKPTHELTRVVRHPQSGKQYPPGTKVTHIKKMNSNIGQDMHLVKLPDSWTTYVGPDEFRQIEEDGPGPSYSPPMSVPAIIPGQIKGKQEEPFPGETDPDGMEQVALGPADTDSHTHTGWVQLKDGTGANGRGFTSIDKGHSHVIVNGDVVPFGSAKVKRHSHDILGDNSYRQGTDRLSDFNRDTKDSFI